MKRILILTDFSKNSRKATTTAFRLYGSDNHYFLMNIYHMPIFGASRGEMYPLIADDSLEKLKLELDQASKVIDIDHFKIDLIAEIGYDEGVIINFIKTRGIDFVVLGKGSSNNLIGSFTASITHNSPVAVLLVPAEYECKAIKKIVFATDLLGVNKKMLVSLLDFAKQNQSEILILNVYRDNKPNPIAYEAHINGYIENISHSYYYVQNNNIVEGITQFAEEQKADQLVILNRKDSLIERLFHTSMTNKLTLHAKRPILVLHD
ncbi:MAG: hypothetical protein GQ527_06355 [Bacteroidales bacterium]|nr:hypothetical protein [Bacteroidales bacterium]